MNELVNKTLVEAFECLLDADSLLKAQRWKAAVSRSYYAMFHTAHSALLSIGNEAYTHQGVHNQFSKHFIKTGILDKSLAYSFSKILDDRLTGDYEIGFKATEEDANYAYNEASKFHSTISNYLNNQQIVP